MYVLVILVGRVQTERDRRETTETVSIQEGLQRVDRGDHHVDTHVELVPVDQQWVLDVLLHHYRLSIGNLREVIDEGDTSTSALGCGFHDPVVVFALFVLKLREAFQEVNVFFRQDEGQRGYIEDLLGLWGHLLGHFYVPLQEILPTHVFRTTEVVATLPDQELGDVYLDLRPSPKEVPAVPHIHTMRQLLPVLILGERPRYYVIDLSAVFHHSVVE